MPKNLVIVESPAKAKTIEKFLGKDYKVLSSYGHIRDLKKKDFSVDVDHDFTPIYEIPSDKKHLVETLKAEAAKADMVWLASDEDREGEAIAWHLYEVLGLNPEKTRRIVFHEITKSAILNAIEHARNIDIDRVNAQQARRVLDRIVGFELSPVLWKKVKPALSAGRVQSVAVRLIVEREKEIEQFRSEAAYRVVATFAVATPEGESVEMKAELNTRLKTKEEALALLEACRDARFTIEEVQVKPARKSPAAPFTTSTLQQEASRKLGLSVAQTMIIAQRLYESGFITYMRTDSVNLSTLALGTSKNEILNNWGEAYLHTRNYHTKTKGAQEAHEAIRPTYIDHHDIEGSAQEKRLYELIWKRTIASQMSDAEIEKKNAMSVKDIFAKKGEPAFREMERDFIESGHPRTGCVISCGGGLVCRDGMPELVKSKGVAVVLFAEPEVIFKRVQGSAKRPLLNVSNPLEKIRELMESRRRFYSRAGVCVGSMGRIEDVEERIARIYLERVRKLSNARKTRNPHIH